MGFTPLSCLLFCSYDLSFKGIKKIKIEDAVSALVNNIMGEESIPPQKSYLHDIIKTQYVDPLFINEANCWEFIQGETNQKSIIAEAEKLSLIKK